MDKKLFISFWYKIGSYMECTCIISVINCFMWSFCRSQKRARSIQWMKEMLKTGTVLLPSMYENLVHSQVLICNFQQSFVSFLSRYVEKCKFPKDGSSPKSLRYIGRYCAFSLLYYPPLFYKLCAQHALVISNYCSRVARRKI